MPNDFLCDQDAITEAQSNVGGALQQVTLILKLQSGHLISKKQSPGFLHLTLSFTSTLGRFRWRPR